MAFDAKDIGRQASEDRKQLQDLKIKCDSLLRDTPEASYDIYRTDREDSHKEGTAVTVKKGIPHIHVGLPPPPHSHQ
jgi:hypothetical protein